MSYNKCVVSLRLGGKIPGNALKEAAAEHEAQGMAPDAAMVKAVEEALELAQMEERKIVATVREAFEKQGGKTKAPKAKAAPKEATGNPMLDNPASWVIRNKETSEVVMETFDKKKVDALNTEKYEAVPIAQHLGEINGKAAAPAPTAKTVFVEGDPDYAALEARGKVNDTAVDALTGDQVEAMHKAMGLKGNTHSTEAMRDQIKKQHPDDVEAALAPQTAPELHEYMVRGVMRKDGKSSASVGVQAENTEAAMEKARADNAWMIPQSAKRVSDRNSAAWAKEGKTEDQLMQDKVDDLAVDLARTVQEEAGEADFDAAELPAAIAMWAKENKVPADQLRAAMLVAIEKRDMGKRIKAKIAKALAPAATAAKVRRADIESTAQGMLATAIENKKAAFKKVQSLRAQLKEASVSDKTAIRFDLLKATDRWNEFKQMERDANDQIDKDAAKQGIIRPSMDASMGFYSALARAIPDMSKVAGKDGMIAPAQASSWLAARQKEGKFKQDELQWSGLPEWLAMQPGKVSVDAIAQFMRENSVQVQEVTKGALIQDFARMTDAQLAAEYEIRFEEEPYEDETRQDIINRLTEVASYDETEGNTDGPDSTKYRDYVLPGSVNYRELLLTLPNKIGADLQKLLDRRAAIEEPYQRRGENLPDSVMGEWRDLNRKISDLRSEKSGDYKSSHWDEANILAHVRFNDRTDADGNKVLFIEELQSDWAQQGLKEGFGPKVALPYFTRANLTDKLTEKYGDKDRAKIVTDKVFDYGVSPYESRDALMSNGGFTEIEANDFLATFEGMSLTGQGSGGVPQGPFVGKTESWLQLGIKRMISYAVEHGYDKVAFINGQQSADRYDLSKQVDTLMHKKNGDGTYTVSAITGGKGNMLGESIQESKLEDFVGKEIAQRIIKGEGKRTEVQGKYDAKSMTSSKDYMFALSGDGLKVGGEGMKSFYDKIVPQNINDVLKKLGGGKVETVDLAPWSDKFSVDEGPGGEIRHFDTRAAAIAHAESIGENSDFVIDQSKRAGQLAGKQVGFTITDAMREKAMGGLPLFSPEASASAMDTTVADMVQDGTSVAKLLAAIAEQSDNADHQALAKAMGGLGLKTGILFENLRGKRNFTVGSANNDNVRGGYRASDDTALLYRADGAEQTMLHELVHAATIRALQRGGLNARNIKALWNAVKALPNFAGEYGISNEEEFVAEAYTNPRFRQMLADTPAPGSKLSFWDKLVGLVKILLGKPAVADSVLSRVMAAQAGLFAENMESDTVTGAERANTGPARTIEVDGVRRPITNSEGGVIADDFAKQQAFYKWFGTSAVADSAGKPLVIYHGTNSESIDAFDQERTGSGSGNDGYFGKGFYAVNTDWRAEEYGDNVLPLYASIQNPFLVDGEKSHAFIQDMLNLKGLTQKQRDLLTEQAGLDESSDDLAMPSDLMAMLFQPAAWDKGERGNYGAQLTKILQQNGFDGVIASNADAESSTEYVVFDAAQFKSAEKNIGTFNATNPDIRANRAAGPGTAAFKNWFNGSQVVDADGNPMMLYHGTAMKEDESITEFRTERPTNRRLMSSLGKFPAIGSFFSESIEVAESFPPVWKNGDVHSTYPVYMSIKNPKKYRSLTYALKDFNDNYKGDPVGYVESLRAQGFDGVYFTEGPSYAGKKRDLQAGAWVPFSAPQVKSAIGNDGNFDPNNGDIRASIAGAADNSILAATTSLPKTIGNRLKDFRNVGLQALGRRQLVDLYAADFVESGKESTLKRYSDLIQQMDADKNESGAQADGIADRWGKLKDGAALADLMHDSTLAQVDPAKNYQPGDDVAAHTALEKRFKALSPEARQLYAEARDAYMEHWGKVRKEIRSRIERALPESPRRAALLEKMDATFYEKVKGVYFPLSRFGDYVISVTGPDGARLAVNFAETMNEADALRKALIAKFPPSQGYGVSKVTKKKEFNAGRDAVSRGFLSELFGVLDQYEGSAELQDDINQLYLASMPDLSWAKHGIHRKGTPGFSQDARRAFAQNMFHGARYLAKLRYSDRLGDFLMEMQDHVESKANDAAYDSVKAQQVVDEMNKRHDAYMNPNSSPLSSTLTSLGFIFYLGLSPASAAVNLTQTPLVTLPMLAAKYGLGKASAALLQASKEAAGNKNDISKALRGDELKAYQQAVNAGVIDVSMAHDLAGIAAGDDNKANAKLRPVMKWASWMFHHGEKFNRQASLLAAYRLARGAGQDHAAAYEAAVNDVYASHFDYSAGNRPRIMQGNVARVVLLFKQYAQNMVYTLTRNAQLAAKGDKLALRTLSGLLISHAMAAGVLGLPVVGTLLAAASVIGGDDDEPWDAKVALRNLIADLIGQKPAEVMMHGLSRLGPFDISGRVGLDKLLLPDVQEGLEGARAAESWMTAALGPVAGIGMSTAKGLNSMAEGRYARGLEEMMPVSLRNPIKAMRFHGEGVRDKTGIPVLDDTTALEEFGQLIGFSPSRSREAMEGKGAVYRAERKLNDRRSALVAQWASAKMAGDTEGVVDMGKTIKTFNEKHKSRMISPANLAASLRSRNKRIAEAEQGIYLPKKHQDVRDLGRFAEQD